MAEKGGFEPPQGLHLLPVFETGPFSRLGISPTLIIISQSWLFAIYFCTNHSFFMCCLFYKQSI